MEFGIRRERGHRVADAVVLALIAVSVLPPAASAGTRAAPWSAHQAAEFWTGDRLRRAQPLEAEPAAPSGAPGGRAANSNARGDGGVAPHLVPPRSAPGGASASATFDEVPEPTASQARQNGAVFFDANGFMARCSGTAVNAPNLSLVFTAGHCVRESGQEGAWYGRRWLFIPAYRHGQRPFGVFPAKWLDATRLWQSAGSENADVGVAVVRRNEHGQTLDQAVGAAGIAWGLPPNQVFDVHGYPVAPPFDGETQRLCAQTPFIGHDPASFLWPGPLTLAVGCDVTGGASGGGWTISGDILNAVTDYGYSDDKNTDFGSYFGKEVARLYERAARIR